jgi:hypothetical protein
MSQSSVTPTYLITMVEAGRHGGRLENFGSGPTDLHWQVCDSVAREIQGPLLVKTNYYDSAHLRDLILHNTVQLVSDRFREVVEPYLQDCEFLPVELELNCTTDINQSGGGARHGGYWWMNSWLRLDIIHWAASDFGGPGLRKGPTGYKGSNVRNEMWRTVRFREAIPADVHMFGLKGQMGDARYISPALHKVILKAGLKVNFAPVITDRQSPSGSIHDRYAEVNPHGRPWMPQKGEH